MLPRSQKTGRLVFRSLREFDRCRRVTVNKFILHGSVEKRAHSGNRLALYRRGLPDGFADDSAQHHRCHSSYWKLPEAWHPVSVYGRPVISTRSRHNLQAIDPGLGVFTEGHDQGDRHVAGVREQLSVPLIIQNPMFGQAYYLIA